MIHDIYASLPIGVVALPWLGLETTRVLGVVEGTDPAAQLIDRHGVQVAMVVSGYDVEVVETDPVIILISGI